MPPAALIQRVQESFSCLLPSSESCLAAGWWLSCFDNVRHPPHDQPCILVGSLHFPDRTHSSAPVAAEFGIVVSPEGRLESAAIPRVTHHSSDGSPRFRLMQGVRERLEVAPLPSIVGDRVKFLKSLRPRFRQLCCLMMRPSSRTSAEIDSTRGESSHHRL